MVITAVMATGFPLPKTAQLTDLGHSSSLAWPVDDHRPELQMILTDSPAAVLYAIRVGWLGILLALGSCSAWFWTDRSLLGNPQAWIWLMTLVDKMNLDLDTEWCTSVGCICLLSLEVARSMSLLDHHIAR